MSARIFGAVHERFVTEELTINHVTFGHLVSAGLKSKNVNGTLKSIMRCKITSSTGRAGGQDTSDRDKMNPRARETLIEICLIWLPRGIHM